VLPEFDEPEELPLLERPVPPEFDVPEVPVLDPLDDCEPPCRVVEEPFMLGPCWPERESVPPTVALSLC